MDPDPDFRPIRIRTQDKKFFPDKKNRIRNTGKNRIKCQKYFFCTFILELTGNIQQVKAHVP